MPMTPHHTPDPTIIHPSLPQNLIDALLDPDARDLLAKQPLIHLGQIPPVLPRARVEEDPFPAALVLDEKGEGGEVEVGLSGDGRFDKG